MTNTHKQQAQEILKEIKEHRKVKVRLEKRFRDNNWEHLESLKAKAEATLNCWKSELDFLDNFGEKGWVEKGKHMLMFSQISERIGNLKQGIKELEDGLK